MHLTLGTAVAAVAAASLGVSASPVASTSTSNTQPDIAYARDVRPPLAAARNVKQQQRSITIPLQRYDEHRAKHRRAYRTPDEVLEHARRQRAYVLGKYANAFNATYKAEQADFARRGIRMDKRQAIGITDVGPDSYYFAQVSVGTPAQVFAIVLDTGSADFWIPGTDCTTSNCMALARFNESASSTYQSSSQPFSVQYGQGSAQGHMAADTVSLADYTVYSQSFAVATNIGEGTLQAPASGLMGMGFQQLSAAGVTPFWQVLAKQNVLQTDVFSFQLARNNDNPDLQSSTQQNPGGVFTLGELDSNQYSGNINWVDIPSQVQACGYWAINLDSLQINGGNTVQLNGVAAIDTGTTLIAVPTNVASGVYNAIPGARSFSQLGQGYYVFPCSTSVRPVLTFGGQQYTVSAGDFNAGAVDSSGQYCLGAIFGVDTGGAAPPFIVGDAFLKNVVSFYRSQPSPQVGFASLKNNGTAQYISTTGGIATPTQQAQNNAAGSSAAAGNTQGPQVSRVNAQQATGTRIYYASGVSAPSASGAPSGSVNLSNTSGGSGGRSAAVSNLNVASAMSAVMLVGSLAAATVLFA